MLHLLRIMWWVMKEERITGLLANCIFLVICNRDIQLNKYWWLPERFDVMTSAKNHLFNSFLVSNNHLSRDILMGYKCVIFENRNAISEGTMMGKEEMNWMECRPSTSYIGLVSIYWLKVYYWLPIYVLWWSCVISKFKIKYSIHIVQY